MPDHLSSDDFSFEAHELALRLIRSVWNEGARAIVNRQHYLDAGNLDDDEISLDLARCITQSHRPLDVGPPTLNSIHTCYCDLCRIKYIYTFLS